MVEISVQVPVKDGGAKFSRFIRSLACQNYSGSWELVLADDGSTIPVESEFAKQLSELPGNCTVKVIRLDPGGNRPAARNAALRASEASVSLLMDADLEFGPDLLERHMEIRSETGADSVMGRRINAWGKTATPWQKWMDSRAMGQSPAGPFPWKYFITGNLSVTTSLLTDAGGFDTSIHRYGGEDTEMGYRLALRGASFHWDPSLAVNHLDDVTVREHSVKMLEYGGSGLKYTLEKHPGTRGLLGSNWVDPIFEGPLALIPMRIFVRVVLQPFLYRFVLKTAETLGGPSMLFTYLSVGACLSGLMGKDLKI